MTAPVFGITVRREANEAAVPSNALMSVIGICMPIEKADGVETEAFEAAFEQGKLLRFNSNDRARLALCDPDGLFIDAVEGINAQLGSFQVAAQLVVVRVAAGGTVDETMANIIGSSVLGTGIHAFVSAGAEVGVYPRIIIVPGYTVLRRRGVASVTVTAGGTGYEVGDVLTATGGEGAGFAATVATVNAGAITSVIISSAGKYETPPALSVTSAEGEGAQLAAVLADTANPVCAALPAVLSQILAVAIVDGPEGLAAFTDWRETLNSERLIPVTPGVIRIDSAGEQVARPAAPRIAGIAVRRDFSRDGRPFRSWANQPVHGIVAPEANYRFSLMDGATEGQQILAAQGGVIVRGEAGDDFAIADGGFVYIGTDNLSDETIWRQYHKVRGRDFIELTSVRTTRQYLGRFNLTTQTIQSVVNTLKAIVAQAVAQGDLLGGEVRFAPDLNNPEDLRAGHIYIDMQFEEAPVFRRATVTTRPYAPALEMTIAELIARQQLIV